MNFNFPSSFSSIYYFDPSNVPSIAMKMTHHGQINRHYPPPFMGGGGGHASNRRRNDRSKGPAEENISTTAPKVGNNEKNSSSNTGSIDVIPEDHQFQGGSPPTEENEAANSGSAAPFEDGSQYTKGGE